MQKLEKKMSDKIFQINWSQVITSLLIGAILGGITLLRFSDSQAIVVAGNTAEIGEIKSVIVPRSELEQVINRLDQRMESIEKSIDSIDRKLD